MQSVIERIRSAGLAWASLAAVGTVVGLLSTAPAAQAKYASIIIDANSGQVLEQVNADDINYPASLTKMMTLYLTFEALHEGRLTLDQKLPVSAHAASRAPSKLNLAVGQTISVHDLVLAVVTHSANDAASVLAEGLGGGSEATFAEHMTAKARQLGMKNTVFYNASGLPSRQENHTTARDLSILARALYRDFPQDYHYFATHEFAYNGTVFYNHNHLMNTFEGMDGIKTGYINASGFNLAASAVRDHHRLIGIVMGGESARSRDHQMAKLLNTAFAKLDNPVLVAKAKSPVTPVSTSVASDNSGDASDDASQAVEKTVAALSPVGRAEAAPVRSHHHAVVRTAAHHVNADWSIQIGAFSHHSSAERAAHAVAGKLAMAKGKPVEILRPNKTDKERFYRVRLASFTKHDAERACSYLHRHHEKCAVVAPVTTRVADDN